MLVERAELENRTRVSRRTGRGFYGTGTAAASCVPQLLCNTTSSCRPGESSLRMGFLAGQGQGSKELPSSSSALWRTQQSSVADLKPGFMGQQVSPVTLS